MIASLLYHNYSRVMLPDYNSQECWRWQNYSTHTLLLLTASSLKSQDEKLQFLSNRVALVNTLPSSSSYLFKFKLNEQSVMLDTDKLSFLSSKNCINYRQYVTWQHCNFISDYEGCSHFVSKNTLAFCTRGFAQPCQSARWLLSGILRNIFKQEKDFQIISFPKLLARGVKLMSREIW